MEGRVATKERERTKARSLLLQVETALSAAVEERERCEHERRGFGGAQRPTSPLLHPTACAPILSRFLSLGQPVREPDAQAGGEPVPAGPAAARGGAAQQAERGRGREAATGAGGR